jgi:hypothetical protein
MLGYSLNKLMGQYSNTFRLNKFSYVSMMPTKTMVAHEKIWRDLIHTKSIDKNREWVFVITRISTWSKYTLIFALVSVQLKV